MVVGYGLATMSRNRDLGMLTHATNPPHPGSLRGAEARAAAKLAQRAPFRGTRLTCTTCGDVVLTEQTEPRLVLATIRAIGWSVINHNVCCALHS